MRNLIANGDGPSRQPSSPARPLRITFVFLGTAIAFARWVVELAQSARSMDGIDSSFIVAADRPLSAELKQIGVRTLEVPAVQGLSPVALLRNFAGARRSIRAFLDEERPDLVVTLMPHVWSPLLARSIKRRCGTYATVVHDAVAHPGDRTGWLTRWLLHDGAAADSVIVLSRSVGEDIAKLRVMRGRNIVQLFHPDLAGDATPLPIRHLPAERSFRLLFFGRIIPYKGLPLLVEAVELLKAEGLDIALGIAGAGEIPPAVKQRLAALGAETMNRWISDDEASALLKSYDAMACSHIEASQSGVAALAFGASMPVVATPVGGLVEQVRPGQTGVLAADITPRAFANAIRDLVTTPGLFESIARHLAATRQERSMAHFLSKLIDTHVDRREAARRSGRQ